MGIFSGGKGGNPDEHVVKPAGKNTWQMSRSREMHLTHGEWRLGQLAGEELRFGERPAMDQNRRP